MNGQKVLALDAIQTAIDNVLLIISLDLFASDRYRETLNKLRDDERILQDTIDD